VDEREVRSTKLVGEKAVDVERVREDDAISFAVIEAERRSRVRGVVARIWIFDRVVATGRGTLLAAAAWMS